MKIKWFECKADGYVPFSGVCPECGSTDLWDDEKWFGCNKCKWIHSQ